MKYMITVDGQELYPVESILLEEETFTIFLPKESHRFPIELFAHVYFNVVEED